MAQIGVVKVTSHLNVRSAPSASAVDIGDLANGAQVLILATADGWHKIAWGAGVAYIAAQYVAIQEYHEATLPAPDYLAALNEKEQTIADLNARITLMINEAFATQQRVKEIEDKAALISAERDNYRSELVTIAGILKKY